MPDKFIETICIQAPLHDVGKVHIHPDTLRKPAKLTENEWEIMKSHTIYGAKIIGGHPRFSMLKGIAITRHERRDGSDCHHGLKGGQILIRGRTINISEISMMP